MGYMRISYGGILMLGQFSLGKLAIGVAHGGFVLLPLVLVAAAITVMDEPERKPVPKNPRADDAYDKVDAFAFA